MNIKQFRNVCSYVQLLWFSMHCTDFENEKLHIIHKNKLIYSLLLFKILFIFGLRFFVFFFYFWNRISHWCLKCFTNLDISTVLPTLAPRELYFLVLPESNPIQERWKHGSIMNASGFEPRSPIFWDKKANHQWLAFLLGYYRIS